MSQQFEANHNKDYSVVKTLGSLVLQRGIFFVYYQTLNQGCNYNFRIIFLKNQIASKTFNRNKISILQQANKHKFFMNILSD